MMISVCMATYNGEKYIKEQLNSILSQLSENDEIIISDDGSTDETLSIIKSLNDKRILLFHHQKENKNNFPLDYTTHNFENAIKHSKGDIIFLSDQDDIWLSNKINLMQEHLKQNDLVISDCKVTDENLNIIYESYFTLRHIKKGILSNIIKNSYLGCCMAFKRDILSRALPFPKSRVGHDLWLGLIANMYYSIDFIYTPLSLYRKHDNNITSSGMKSFYPLWFKVYYRTYIIKAVLARLICNK